MTGESLGFWAVAVVLLAASLAVVLSQESLPRRALPGRGPGATAGVFLLLIAPFLFAVQLLLYAGGVVTLVVFAIMLTERLVGDAERRQPPRGQRRHRVGRGLRGASSASCSSRRGPPLRSRGD